MRVVTCNALMSTNLNEANQRLYNNFSLIISFLYGGLYTKGPPCLLAIGYWLLVIVYWLLAIGYWLARVIKSDKEVVCFA
jgi:hypothetical protein